MAAICKARETATIQIRDARKFLGASEPGELLGSAGVMLLGKLGFRMRSSGATTFRTLRLSFAGKVKSF